MPDISRRFSPRATTTIGLALIFLLLIANMFIAEWNIGRLVENERRVLKSQEILTTIEEVLARVTEAEAAERGFLITNDPEYLKPYEAANVGRLETLERLERLTADEPEQRRRVQALHEDVQARMEELRQAIAANRAGGFSAARQAVSTNQGRRLMNEMRGLVADMRKTEQASLTDRAEQSRHSAGMTTMTNQVDTGLGIGLVCLAFFLFRRELALRKRAEDAALRLVAIVQSSDDAIISKTLEGDIVSWNPGAERIYGYTAAEAVGRPINMLCPPDRLEQSRRNMADVCRGLHLAHFETSRVRKDGRRIDVSLSISPITDTAGQVVGAAAIARDITERKTLQREVLEIAAREQRRIGQDLHDDLGQELTGLGMLAQRLVGVLSRKDAADDAAAVAKIGDGLDYALRQVRALSKGLVPVEVDAEGLMAALADLAARTSELNDIDCTFECDKPVLILDNQTATHLYRMSQEGVTNALKHGKARHISISLNAEPDRVSLSVVDDGIGLDEPSREGTAGTGLRIMRYRAELIGAKLTIDKVEPHGTRLTCSFSHQVA